MEERRTLSVVHEDSDGVDEDFDSFKWKVRKPKEGSFRLSIGRKPDDSTCAIVCVWFPAAATRGPVPITIRTVEAERTVEHDRLLFLTKLHEDAVAVSTPGRPKDKPLHFNYRDEARRVLRENRDNIWTWQQEAALTTRRL